MVSIAEQIAGGKLVCPQTRAPLELGPDQVTCREGGRTYPLVHGVPILLTDRKEAEKYAQSSSRMNQEYEAAKNPPAPTVYKRVRRNLRRMVAEDGDYRTEACRQALRDLFISDAPDAVYLSVGGGPVRQDPRLTNLNIGPFPNVEVVADAHELPYADGKVDGLLCEAVLEHLATPEKAVTEMFRVLKPGGRCLVITPLLQGYHGYPNHFQNYTLTGHELLMKRGGFRVLSSGAAVGPMVMWVELTGRMIRELLPKPLAWAGDQAWAVAGAFLKPLDKRLNRLEHAHFLASSTFVLCEKPK